LRLVVPDPSREPDLKIGSIAVTVLGRPYPDADHPFDQDMLNCLVTGATARVSIKIEDTGIRSYAIDCFMRDLMAVYEALTGEAVLDGSDLGLVLSVRPTAIGHIEVRSEFWPEEGWDAVTLIETLDQSYLPDIIKQCRAVLGEFPVRFPAS
jgi:hypothetical protein